MSWIYLFLAIIFETAATTLLKMARGSYADIALQHGASIKFIQNQLGHQKAETTLNIYMKYNQDMVDKALEKMNGIFSSEEMEGVFTDD